jgi:hypothetical protein
MIFFLLLILHSVLSFIQKNFYCSDDSFQTPLESPCAEPENYFNDESAEQLQPLLVLTSPDNEALSIED